MSHSAGKTQQKTLLMIGSDQSGGQIGNMIEQSGYAVAQASSARDAVSRISRGEASVVLLDLTAGHASLELADLLLGLPACPPIVVLDREPSMERVIAAMRMGVTDYLFLSEGDRQVADRLIAHLAHAQPKAHEAAAFHNTAFEPAGQEKRNGAVQDLTGLDLNTARRILTLENVPILLSAIELSLMELLVRRAPSLVTYEEMAGVAFPNTSDVEHALRLLRPHIARLRRKFESVPNARWRIANLRGQGYALQRIGAPAGFHAAQPAKADARNAQLLSN